MSEFNKFNPPRLIGISGTFASGKDTAARYLVEVKGFMHLSTGDLLRAEADKTNIGHDRATLIEISVKLRKDYGSLGALVLKGIDNWKNNRNNFPGGLVVSGLRIMAESEEIKNQNGLLLFIDAPDDVRYQRMKSRAKSEGRIVELENINNLEDFIQSEVQEMQGLGGEERPNILGVKNIADCVIQNNHGLVEFYNKIDHAIDNNN